MNILISIILPCYNSEKYIHNAIESVLNQTYNNWELIIVDDYSIDNTVKLIDKYYTKDNRIKLVKNNMNYGTYYSLNEGLKISKGDYITKIDSDDIYDKNKLKKQLDFCIRNNIEGCTCNIVQKYYKRGILSFINIPNMSSLMFSTKILKSIGYYDNCRFDCDSEYLHRIKNNFNILNIEENLYIANYRKNSLTTSYNSGCYKNQLGVRIRKIYKYNYHKISNLYVYHPKYTHKYIIHNYQKSPIESLFIGDYTIFNNKDNLIYHLEFNTKLGCCIEFIYKCIPKFNYNINNNYNYKLFLCYENNTQLNYTVINNNILFTPLNDYIKIKVYFNGSTKNYKYFPLLLTIQNENSALSSDDKL